MELIACESSGGNADGDEKTDHFYQVRPLFKTVLVNLLCCSGRGISDARYASMIAAASKISDKGRNYEFSTFTHDLLAAGKFKSASQVRLEYMVRYRITTGS